MDIEFDPAKDEANIAKHGISLSRTGELDILATIEDTRPEDNERRFRLLGLIEEKAYCAVVTFRGSVTRSISLRRASRAERKEYDLR